VKENILVVDELGLVRMHLSDCYVEQLSELLGLSLFQKLAYSSRMKRIEGSWLKVLRMRLIRNTRG
jgi:hypothetical protein